MGLISRVSSRTYRDMEYLVCNALCTLFSVLTIYFSYMNYTWQSQNTSAAQKFGFEMNQMMGKMLGFPQNFTKIEGTMLALASLGCLSSWSSDAQIQFYSLVLLSFGVMYFLVCLAYFICVEEGVPLCLGLIVYSGGLVYWKYVSFLDVGVYGDDLMRFFGYFGVILVIAAGKMFHGASGMKKDITQWLQLSKYCNENPNFVWEAGKSAPNGFDDK